MTCLNDCNCDPSSCDESCPPDCCEPGATDNHTTGTALAPGAFAGAAALAPTASTAPTARGACGCDCC